MLRSSQRGGLGGAGREKAAGERLTFNTTFLSLERAVRDGALVRRGPERPQFEEFLSRHPVHNYEFEDEIGDSVPYLDAA